MNRFRFEALLSEFPALKEILTNRAGDLFDPTTCDELVIKRLTHEVLEHVPKEYSWDGSLVGINEWEAISFVLTDGGVLRDAVKCSGVSGSNYAHSEQHSWEGESVLEAVNRHDVANQIALVVQAEGGYDVVEHYSQQNWRATIYKPAKDFTMEQVIEEARRMALAEVKAEAEF